MFIVVGWLLEDWEKILPPIFRTPQFWDYCFSTLSLLFYLMSRPNAFQLEASFHVLIIPGRDSLLFRSQDDKNEDRTHDDPTLLQFKSRKTVGSRGKTASYLQLHFAGRQKCGARRRAPCPCKQSWCVCTPQLRSLCTQHLPGHPCL